MKSNDEEDIEIGSRLKILRKKCNKNQDEFAIFIEIDKQTLLRYEKGHRSPNGLFFKKIQKKIPNINLHWLLTGEGDMYIPEPVSVLDTNQTPNFAKTNNKEYNIVMEELYKSPALTRSLAFFFRNKEKNGEALDYLANSISLSSEILKKVQT